MGLGVCETGADGHLGQKVQGGQAVKGGSGKAEAGLGSGPLH